MSEKMARISSVVAGGLLVAAFSAGCSVSPDAVNTYVQACIPTTSTGTSLQRTMQIDGVMTTTTINFYGNPFEGKSDTTCSTSPVSQLVSVSKNDVLGALSPNPNTLPTLKLNVTVVSAQWTALSATIATSEYNQNISADGLPLCGISTWAQSVAQDVTGRTCGTTIVGAVGAITYGVVSYDNAGNQYLYDITQPAISTTTGLPLPAGLSDVNRLTALEVIPAAPATGGVLWPYVKQ